MTQGAAADRFAPAKVNLSLRVGPPGPDGYHPIESLVAFADVGDRLRLEPAEAFAFAAEGPFAGGLAGEGNLVVRAVRALAAAAGESLPPVRLVLDKQLPVAAGLGGGSSDAAAALRLVRDAGFAAVEDAVLFAIAADLGADAPMCLEGRPLVARGRGERLEPVEGFAELAAVLVNPGVACPTAEVYRAFDARLGDPGAGWGDDGAGPDDEVRPLRDFRGVGNDLESAAISVAPAVGEALALLRARADFAAVSGSGATCFALCSDYAAATALAAAVSAARPAWWTRPCRLGGPWA